MATPRIDCTLFDDCYQEVCSWWDAQMAPLYEGHSFAQEAGTLKKIEEEFVEFLRDPSHEEAADVMIAIMVWCHIRGVDLSNFIMAKVLVNSKRQWSMHPSGALHHH